MVFASAAYDASSQECDIIINKVATPDDGTIFTFLAENSQGESEIEIPGGSGFGSSLPDGDTVIITEEVPPGWRLADVVCERADGIFIELVENGFLAECGISGGVAVTTCTFFNVQTDVIPTLSEWGMIAAAAGLGLIAVFFAVRRKRMQDA